MGSQMSSTCTEPATHSIVRTSRWSASQSIGGRVWPASSPSSSCQAPIVSASRTMTQPVWLIHVVSSTFVPGT
jgi:hypothetical protein